VGNSITFRGFAEVECPSLVAVPPLGAREVLSAGEIVLRVTPSNPEHVDWVNRLRAITEAEGQAVSVIVTVAGEESGEGASREPVRIEGVRFPAKLKLATRGGDLYSVTCYPTNPRGWEDLALLAEGTVEVTIRPDPRTGSGED